MKKKNFIIRVKKKKNNNCLATVHLILTYNKRRVQSNAMEVIGFNYPRDPNRIVSIKCARLGFLLNKGVILHKSARKLLSELAGAEKGFLEVKRARDN